MSVVRLFVRSSSHFTRNAMPLERLERTIWNFHQFLSLRCPYVYWQLVQLVNVKYRFFPIFHVFLYVQKNLHEQFKICRVMQFFTGTKPIGIQLLLLIRNYYTGCLLKIQHFLKIYFSRKLYKIWENQKQCEKELLQKRKCWIYLERFDVFTS